ncbi:MAG: hypothetical protein GXO40_04470 [Epsilonproteobacteria bacterium]|nr:hypothetical protein [Campylobacterota bacterium]
MRRLANLIQEVVIPVEKQILQDDTVASLLHDKETIARHNFGIAKLSIALLYDGVRAKELLIQAAKAHHSLDIPAPTVDKYMKLFFVLHKKWMHDNFQTDEYYNKIMDRFDELFAKVYEAEDEFLMFEGEEVDEMINSMHYTDDKKISAKEYFEYNELMSDDIAHLREIAQECEELEFKYHELSPEFLEMFANIIRVLAHILFQTYEFTDIGYAMQTFIKELESLDLEQLDATQREFAWNVISQLNADIQTWIRSIFVEQSAVDIHYFDASFLANLAQFDIMLKAQSQENLNKNAEDDIEDDDDFLF